MSSQARKVQQTIELRHEIQQELEHGALPRRAMYKKILLAGGALAAISQLRGAGRAWAGDLDPGPPTTPFTEELVHVNRDSYVKRPEALTPAPPRTAAMTPPPARKAQGGAAPEDRAEKKARKEAEKTERKRVREAEKAEEKAARKVKKDAEKAEKKAQKPGGDAPDA